MKKLLKVKPMFNRIITTMDVYEKDQYNGNIIDTTNIINKFVVKVIYTLLIPFIL